MRRGDVRRGQLARDAEVGGAMEQQALGDAHEVVGAPLRLQLHRELGQLVDRLVDLADLRRRLGQPDARRDVVRVQPDDLAQRGQRLLDLARLLQLVRGQLQLAQRVRDHPLLPVGLGQPLAHVRQPGRQLEDALVDRHRLARKTLLHVDLGGAQVDVARLLQRAAPGVDLRHLQPGAGVVRIFLDDARELLERALFLPPLQELLGGGEMLVLS